MAYNQSQKNASIKYAKEKLHRIPLDVKNEKYDEIKNAANAAGYTSVRSFIMSAIEEKINKI